MAQGRVLRVNLQSPTYHSDRYGEVPSIDAVATHDSRSGEISIFVVNRDVRDPAQLTVDLLAFGELAVVEAWTLSDQDWLAVNTQEAPDRVCPRPTQSVSVTEGRLRAELPAVSWSAVRLRRIESDI
jgi:alpha-N-arabinofuranosidase